MMSVTSLRNIKKVIYQFLFQQLEEKQKAFSTRREFLQQRIKTKTMEQFNFPNLTNINVDYDGYVTVTFRPKIEEVDSLKKLNKLSDKAEKEFQEDVNLVDRYFTLAEASNILNIPEMPPRIKEILDNMINSLR